MKLDPVKKKKKLRCEKVPWDSINMDKYVTELSSSLTDIMTDVSIQRVCGQIEAALLEATARAKRQPAARTSDRM